MELLNPVPPSSSPEILNGLFSPESEEQSKVSGDIVYVSVGKSVEKALSLLQWSFKHFRGREICLLHVHKLNHVIPTPLGKLPASKANSKMVIAFRREEKEQMEKLLNGYLYFCAKIKVKVRVLVAEADQVHKGIVELVKRYGINKLVMGTVENCRKVRSRSSKVNYAAKNASSFCEIFFVNKGKHVWTREASGETCSLDTSRRSTITIVIDAVTNWGQDEVPLSSTLFGASLSIHRQSLSSSKSSSADSAYTLSERIVSSDTNSSVEEGCVYSELQEAEKKVMATRNEAFSGLLLCRKSELEAMEVITKAKALESSHALEVKLTRQNKDMLETTIKEQEKFLEEKDKLGRELENNVLNITLLDKRARKAKRRCEEVAKELKLIENSVATLRLEKHKIRQQKLGSSRWLDRWNNRGQAEAANCSDFNGFIEDLPQLSEFSLAELKTATCNFSESFKIGQGGHGCVYKGEMLGRTVAVKRLHQHNVQGNLKFQQEVQVLSKLQHPHLVTLLGVCCEAWSLVYEYLPNGSLQDRLFRKSNISALTWKTRVRILADVSSALCFLHSSKPEHIIHGDLKPENILLDPELGCKVCDFGICRLVNDETLHSPSFREDSEPKGVFPYTDPEYQRNGCLTHKSDIYSFGLIILQMLTGKPPVALVSQVQKVVSSGKLVTILDFAAGEWPMFVARRLVDIGLQCCELYGRDRPDLTPSLVRELEQLHISDERTVPSFFLCPILQEIMHDPQVATDGFTYEADAIRDWLQNGRETSPMTNLKLSHLHLTPNHALRIAIQNWLCKS